MTTLSAARTTLTVVTLLALCSVWVYTSAQNFVPKYNGSGTLVDSAITEVDGSVGINVTSPSARLEVKSAGLSTSPLILRNSANANPLFEILEGGSGNANLYLYRVDGTKGVVLVPGPAGINYVMGSLGVGTTTPATKLHVAGDVTVEGNIGARYQDVAEWVDADDSLPTGTVVTTDPERSNHVRSSDKAYDTSVAGVITKRPGILLGTAGRGKVAVAQSGRVRVKVDATFGAIKPGDLLVTSPTPAHAMKSEPILVGEAPIHRPGTIIGKALEPLPNGQGEVLALITLQ
jgi:hypothetical protein